MFKFNKPTLENSGILQERNYVFDRYTRELLVTYSSVKGEVIDRNICILTNGVGHCCGATFISRFDNWFWKDLGNITNFFNKIKKSTDKHDPIIGHNWPVNVVYFYLSKETSYWDKALITHPNVQKVHTFLNRTIRSSGEPVDLYFTEVSKW
jgi:hypothetical protein